MIIGHNIAATGIKAFDTNMMVISNNISNIQTPAYKRKRVEFETMFPSILADAVAEIDEESFDSKGRKRLVFEIGNGVNVVDITQNMAQGPITNTENPYDVAISGEGYFQFKRPDGRILYGRAGNLRADKNGYLSDSHGNLLDPPIQLPMNRTGLRIDFEGRVYVEMDRQGQDFEVGQIMLAYFSNPAKLRDVGQNLYAKTAESGEPKLVRPYQGVAGRIMQSSIEGSNVNAVQEMMSILMNQRAFQMASQSFQMTDAMLKQGLQ